MPSQRGLQMSRPIANNVDEMLEVIKAAKGETVLLKADGQTVKVRLSFELDGDTTVSIYEMWLFGLERWQSCQESTLRTVLEKAGPYTHKVLGEMV
jgi:hypothetical protein